MSIMYQTEKKRKRFHKQLIQEYFQKYEQPMYQKNTTQIAEKKFVSHYIKKLDWDKQYNNLLNQQYKKLRNR